MLHCFQHSSSSPSTPCPRMKFSSSDAEPCATMASHPASIHWGVPKKHIHCKVSGSVHREGMCKQLPPGPFFFFLEHPRQTHAGVKIPLLSHVKVALCLLSCSSASAGTCCHFCHDAFTTTWAGVLLTHYSPCSTAFTHPTETVTAILFICA